MGYQEFGTYDSERPAQDIRSEKLNREPWVFYDKVTFEGATRRIVIEDGTIKGFTVSGDINSENWDGTTPLSLPDTGASLGYALDASSGRAQFEGNVYLGGSLLVEGDISNGTTASYMVIPASTGAGSVTNPMLQFFSGGAYELAEAKIYTNYASTFTQLFIEGAQGGAGANYGMGQIILDGSSSAGIVYLIPRGYGTSNATLIIQPTVAGTGTSSVSISADGTTITSTVTVSGKIQNSSGSAAAPTYTFTANTAYGIYYASSAVHISANSTLRFSVDTSGIVVAGRMDFTSYLYGPYYYASANGSVSAPVVSRYTDQNTGIYWVTGDYIAMAAGGQIIQQWGYSSPNKEVYLYGLPSHASHPYVRFNTSTGQLYYDSSRRALKENIEPLRVGDYAKLQPVRFDMRDGSAKSVFGFIAEDVAEAFPSLAHWGHERSDVEQDTDPIIVNYEDRGILALTVAEVQRQGREIEALKKHCKCGILSTKSDMEAT